jgi:hypothetical protein
VYSTPFVLSAPQSETLLQNGTTSFYLQVTPTGSSGTVTLSASNLPTGTSAVFAPSSIVSGQSLVTLTASATAAIGTSAIRLNGQTATGDYSTYLALPLTISAPSSKLPTAAITVNSSGPVAGPATITISFNGFSETLHYDKSSSATSVASAFAVMFSRDYLKSSGLCAAASGNAITFKLKQGAFQPITISGTGTAFQLVPAGFL